MDFTSILVGGIVGIGLASAAGFRVFVPLFLISAVSYFGLNTSWMPFNLGENWSWLGSSTALIAFGVASLVELIGYMIPWIDNMLDIVAVPAATVAGSMLAATQLDSLGPVLQWALAIIAGGGTATLVKSSAAATRLASSATTAGVANPAISVVESASAGVMSIVSVVFSPLIIFIFVLLVGYLVYKTYKGIYWFRRKYSQTE